jgi:hypothetical protein
VCYIVLPIYAEVLVDVLSSTCMAFFTVRIVHLRACCVTHATTVRTERCLSSTV